MRIKIFRIILSTFCIGFILISCGKSSKEVFRIDSLNDSCWQSSLWISVANAPVVKEKVYDGTRAADGASWFMSTVKNDKKVSRALWMTTGLGVYEIYVNGKLVGDEILKPGFTHHEKTKLSFTYDVTGFFKTASGDENVLSAQVTPGWWADKIITPGGMMV